MLLFIYVYYSQESKNKNNKLGGHVARLRGVICDCKYIFEINSVDDISCET
jgi:hypothetical protein